MDDLVNMPSLGPAFFNCPRRTKKASCMDPTSNGIIYHQGYEIPSVQSPSTIDVVSIRDIQAASHQQSGGEEPSGEGGRDQDNQTSIEVVLQLEGQVENKLQPVTPNQFVPLDSNEDMDHRELGELQKNISPRFDLE